MKVNVSRIFQLFRYLNPLLAFRIAIHEASRALFNPNSRHTYSQSGEDVLLPRYLDLTKPGYYVDVGCHHPVKVSNAFSLYLRGWRGLAIDGNPDCVKLFNRHRPRDIAVCAVISDVERPVSFAIASVPELSTVSEIFEGKTIKRIQMQSTPLQRILIENQCPCRFEFLSIDCEGHDYKVLKSFDIDYYRPRVLIIEMHGFKNEECASNKIYSYLINKKYKMVAFNWLNGFFVDDTCS